MKITEGIKIVLSYGSYFDYMIDLSEELLNERIYSTSFDTVRKTGFSSPTGYRSNDL
jgi:hypothetical protein